MTPKSKPVTTDATDADAPPPSVDGPELAARLDAPAIDVRANEARIETISLIFDPGWYRWKYRDVEIARIDPVAHYLKDGHREGRNPNRFFDTAWYAQSNPDVVATGANPFLHYVLYGAREGRKPRP